jgi:hypothetical protein
MDESEYNSPQIRILKRLSLLPFVFIGALPAVLNAAPPETSWELVPPDLPLPASAPCTAPWMAEANMLQPVAHSQFTMMTRLGDRPRHLQTEFGFNAITIQPPDSHNCDTGLPDRDRITEEQFRAGMAAYRAAGYHVLLYTSVEACGQTPEFQSGQVAREHPEWSQRDPKGNPVLVYGQPWLCPSGGARQYALDRAVRITRQYQPDGILLDNSEFFFAKDGWTCHCASCQKAFRGYVRKRFGVERTKRFFGVAPDQLEIPSAEGPLFALWLQWRNRVWAEINESFRARLREVNPKIMIVANTQYLYENACLATDLQYVHEDAVVSESVGLDSWQMSRKMALGSALAEGRPLWNYIGTFTEADTYTGIKPAEVISPLIIATIAHQARPWIVDGFDDGHTDPLARQAMSKLLAWHNTHPQFYTNTPWARAGVVLSLSSRNALHRALIPESLGALLSAGVPAAALRDEDLSAEKLSAFHVVTVETAACLGEISAKALAEWVRGGGILVAAPDAGCYDVLGRKLPHSVLWKALGLEAAPSQEISVGRGKVVSPGQGAFSQTAVRLAQADSFLVTPRSGVEVVPYTTKQSLILHLVRHQAAARPIALRVPNEFHPTTMNARLRTPDSEEAQLLPLVATGDGLTFSLPTTPEYGVIEIPIR